MVWDTLRRGMVCFSGMARHTRVCHGIRYGVCPGRYAPYGMGYGIYPDEFVSTGGQGEGSPHTIPPYPSSVGGGRKGVREEGAKHDDSPCTSRKTFATKALTPRPIPPNSTHLPPPVVQDGCGQRPIVGWRSRFRVQVGWVLFETVVLACNKVKHLLGATPA